MLSRYVALSVLLLCTCCMATPAAEAAAGAQPDVTVAEEVMQRYRDSLLQVEMVELA